METDFSDRLEVSVSGLVRMRSEEECLLIDCREPEEYAIARIEGARLIPMQEISRRLDELESWREKPLVVHCHHGVRSLRVVEFLRGKGFLKAKSLIGGIDAWSLEVDATVPRY
jgi:rhodanese-related sulfurtransferase